MSRVRTKFPQNEDYILIAQYPNWLPSAKLKMDFFIFLAHSAAQTMVFEVVLEKKFKNEVDLDWSSFFYRLIELLQDEKHDFINKKANQCCKGEVCEVEPPVPVFSLRKPVEDRADSSSPTGMHEGFLKLCPLTSHHQQ